MLEIQGHKYLWHTAEHDKEQVWSFARSYNITEAIIKTLMSRGMVTREALDQFLYATPEMLVGDTLLFKDALKAVERIERAIRHQEKILIAGDYDVDGVTSSALMLSCLRSLNAQVNFFLPNRKRDGYGLSTTTVEKAAAKGFTLIITVDNGITAFEAAERARLLQVDLIITDHHRPGPQLPPAYAIINPHQEGCEYPFKHFAGVGISFKLMSLLFSRQQRPLPAKAYELLLLGTIADVVPLIGENRYWVQYALRIIQEEESFALKVLKDNARCIKPKLSSRDIGFYLTPQINALGRLDDARSAVSFLLSTNEAETQKIGTLLQECNLSRKQIEQAVVKEIVTNIESGAIDLSITPILIAADQHWPAGVIGLAAGRLVSRYNRPAIVFHLANGLAKGSCRSIPEIDILELLHATKDLLISYGGHPMAAGLSLAEKDLPELNRRLQQLASERIDLQALKPRLMIDSDLLLPDVNKKLIKDLELLEPFGAEHREPLFCIQNVSLAQEPQFIKNEHVKCMVCTDGILKPVVFFYRPELYPLLCQQGTKPFSLAVSINENHWNGKTSIELCGIDMAF